MTGYDKYKPSGIDWVGEIPKNWQLKRIKNICSFIYGDSLAEEDRADGDIAVYGSNGATGFHNQSNTLNPCIIIGRKGSFGKINYSCEPVFAIDTTYFIDNRYSQHSLRWLYYILTSLDLDKFSKDTGVPGLNREDSYKEKIPLPPKEEQIAIANYLDHQTQKIDSLISNKKSQIEKLKELRQIEINNAVTKGLNQDVEMKESGVEWLGKIPKHWQVKKIKNILKPDKNAIKTGPFGSDLKFEDLVDTGIKVYNQRNVLDKDFDFGEGYITEKKYKTLETCTIFPEDILITTRGTIGKAAIFPKNAELGILHPCLMRIQMNSKICFNQFIELLINESSCFIEALKYQSNATTIDVVYSDNLKEIKIALPPIEEQISITDYLLERIKFFDSVLINLSSQIQKLEELRKIKIYEAVTGKVFIPPPAITNAGRVA